MGRVVAQADRRQARQGTLERQRSAERKPVPSLGFWDNWGPDWKAWIGSAWLRERVTLTAAEAAQAATLSLSAIDDMDQTFVNGVAVGGKNEPTNARSYQVPKGVL
jgi:sialate O-acetylesterase